MSFKIYWEGRIKSAHKLELPYKSKCQNLHGHEWKIQIWITGEPNRYGILFDFSHLKELISKYDHEYLNDILSFNPTAENLAKNFAELIKLMANLPENHPGNIEKIKVRVWEDKSSYAEFEMVNKTF